ncbi:MAG: arsenate reductase (glutaredoxin) [Lysobacterales bacterium]
MSDVLILHNPRCSKSRAALALLRERGVEPRIVDYLREPPDAEQLAHWVALLGVPVREALRREEADYARLALDDPALSDAELIAAAIAHPHLIQRPLVVSGARAAIGRPPEAVLGLL